MVLSIQSQNITVFYLWEEWIFMEFINHLFDNLFAMVLKG